MELKNIEIYTYTKTDLIENQQSILLLPELDNKKSLIQNVVADLFENNNKVGNIIYINNYIQYNDLKINTSIGTITTKNGKIVFNLSYDILTSNEPQLDANRVLQTRATHKSGIYNIGFQNDVLITIQSIGDQNETRILTIQY